MTTVLVSTVSGQIYTHTHNYKCINNVDLPFVTAIRRAEESKIA